MIKDNILILGCGKMGSALLTAISSKVFDPKQIQAVDPTPNAQLAYDIHHKYNIKIHKNSSEVPADFRIDTIIFALKPQTIETVLSEYRTKISEEMLLVSIIAGKKIAFFEKYLGEDKKIVRTMPNLPATVHEGATALFATDNLSGNDRKRAENIFNCVGETFWLQNEDDMNAVTAISGSGPAYVFYFMESFIKAAMELGLSENMAEDLVLSTMRGCIKLNDKSHNSIEELKEQVISPGGTTEAAMNILSAEHVLENLMKYATKAAFERSKKLGGA